MRFTGDSLTQGCHDDDHELNAVHALTADDICEPSEEQLTEESTDGGGDLDAEVLVWAENLSRAIDIAQHCGGNVDSEDIVGIREETNASYCANSYVEPTRGYEMNSGGMCEITMGHSRELCIVDVCEGSSTALVKRKTVCGILWEDSHGL